MKEVVAILGASKNQSRYANKAQNFLIEKGHTVIPINPKYDIVDGVKCYPDLASCPQNIDTITAYVRPSLLSTLVQGIIQVSPYRVIFNPGTTNENVIDHLEKAGIEIQMACTLVLLSTSQF
ncbi:MAG: CoA-binding protein [Gammaproteobacteria bacterium]